jgi:hypothetical protein
VAIGREKWRRFETRSGNDHTFSASVASGDTKKRESGNRKSEEEEKVNDKRPESERR